VKRRIILGTYVLSSGYYDAYYLRAQKVRTLIREDFLNAYREVDAILTPTSPTPAFRKGEKAADPLAMYLSDVYTIGVNLAGLPGVSIPCGFSKADCRSDFKSSANPSKKPQCSELRTPTNKPTTGITVIQNYERRWDTEGTEFRHRGIEDRKDINHLTEKIIGSAIEVQRMLGSGLTRICLSEGICARADVEENRIRRAEILFGQVQGARDTKMPIA